MSNNNSNVDEFIIEAPEEDPNFDKLNNLVNVLENDIRKAHGNSIAIENVLVSIRSSAYESSHSQQAEHVSLLYCHMAEEMKSQQQKSAPKLNYQEQDEDDNNSDTVSLTGEIPFFLYSGSSRQIVGWEALNRNVFYSRASTAVCSFVAFVIMSCVPYVSWRSIDPNKFLEPNCGYKGYYEGEFSFVSFQYIIALCVIIFLHNALWILYYVLPVDTADRKYVPGMRSMFDSFLNPSDVTSYGQKLGDFFHLYSKSLEPILDGGFLMMITLASIIAAMNLEHGVIFYNTYEADALRPYFSIASFMETFDKTGNCLNSNPAGLVRASLTMSFLATFCLAFTFQVTFRSFLLERKRQKLGEGGGGGRGSLASQQLPNDSEDNSNTPREYESSSSFQLPSGDAKKFVRV
mmetsp:Transcript_8052/g.13652  ORF Transcript_8052/g.13652 Transcript_8052/m.13652 type:complete len:405 (-) Transcript_8052:1963-3177(-)